MDDNIKALFVGLNTVDLQFMVNEYPGANTKTKADKNEICAGGPATNAAIACGFLGGDVTLLSPIGKHSLSKFILEEVSSWGVTINDPINHFESKPVFASIITSQINGERTIFSYHPKNQDDILYEIDLGQPQQYQIALFDGFYPDLAIPVARAMQKHGVTTVLDGGSWKPGLDDLLKYIDIAICSNDFYVPGTGNKLETISALEDLGIKKIAITRGHEEIISTDEGLQKNIQVPKVDSVDTLGAGDIFHGAFCYYFALHPNFDLALKNAAQIASLSCRYFGTREWMKNFIKSDITV